MLVKDKYRKEDIGLGNKKVILFGNGKLGKEIAEKLHRAPDFELVEIWDNDVHKHNHFEINRYLIKAPQKYAGISVLIGVYYFVDEIKKDLIDKYDFPEKEILDWHDIKKIIKNRIITDYHDDNDHEIQEIISNLKNNDLEVFNYEFTKKYHDYYVDISWDSNIKLFFAEWNEKKIYFRRSMDKQHCLNYMRQILMEQDPQSPHYYNADGILLKDGAVAIDAGAAEGIFGLSLIDKIEKLFLVECDEEWIEALRYTFAPYGKKVEIISRKLSDIADEEHTTIDAMIRGGRLDVVKMDIEGYEAKVISGMQKTILYQSDFLALVCAYHNSDDEVNLSYQLEKMGFSLSYSRGYMYFEFMDKIVPQLVKGLILAAKGEYLAKPFLRR